MGTWDAPRARVARGITFVLGLAVVSSGCVSVPPPVPSVTTTTAASAVVEKHLTPAQIAHEANRSVVQIEHAAMRGSGFVAASDGRIVTNFHVVEGADDIKVTFPDRRKLAVTAIWVPDPTLDLVVLQVDATGLVPLRLGDSKAVQPGDHIVAIGNPRGLDHTVSDGLISAIRDERKIPLLQISAPISPGSSGGPVFNDAGEVVGITLSTLRDAQNVNFAIPSAELAAILAQKPAPVSLAEFRTMSLRGGASRGCDVQRPNARDCDEQCKSGDAASCTELGYLFRRATGVQRDDAKAAELYKRGCDGGDIMGCSNLAALYRSGEGVDRDPKRAAELFQSSCDRGGAQGCWGLGQLHRTGEGVTKSAGRANQLLERACDGKLGEACMEAAELAERGKGKKIDRVTSFYQRACDHGEPKGCTRLGKLLTEGRAIAHDEGRAAVLFHRACDARDVEGCAHYGKLLVDGRGATVDRAHGIDLLRAACRQGSGWSCERLQALGEKR